MMEKDKLKEALKEPLEKLKKMVNEDLRKPCNKDLAINFGRNGLRVTKEDLPMNEEELDEVKIKLGESYEDIILFLKDYIDMKEENYPLLALWIIGTYFHKSFSTFPYLFVNAMRGSGRQDY